MREAMGEQELVTYVLAQAGKHVNHDDIVLAVCQQLDLDWGQADARVNEILDQHQHALARRQGPLLILISLVVLLAGIGAAGLGLYYFLFEARFDSWEFVVAGLQANYALGAMVVIGLAMIAGSIYGLSKVLVDLLHR